MKSRLALLLLALLPPLLLALPNGSSKRTPLIVVSMDGFRHDFLEKFPEQSAFLRELTTRGVLASNVESVFKTSTFPVHWSIATGLYQESHGIVSNNMYDPVLKATFDKGTRDPVWWNASLPFWVSARRQGLKTATFFWPGSEVYFDGQRASICREYKESVDFEERAATVADWVARRNVSFATMYLHQPDLACHHYGPDSHQVASAVRSVDRTISTLFNELERAGVVDNVNVIILSDHGCTALNWKKRLIKIREPPQHLASRVVDQGSIFTAFAQPGKTEALRRWLLAKIGDKKAHAKVYTKQTLPRRLHYTHNNRIPDLLVLPEPGWLVRHETPWFWKDGGAHGYDSGHADMRTLLIGVGPAFKKGAKVTGFRLIDVYGLACRLLEIKAHPNNGSDSLFHAMLNSNAGGQ